MTDAPITDPYFTALLWVLLKVSCKLSSFLWLLLKANSSKLQCVLQWTNTRADWFWIVPAGVDDTCGKFSVWSSEGDTEWYNWRHQTTAATGQWTHFGCWFAWNTQTQTGKDKYFRESPNVCYHSRISSVSRALDLGVRGSTTGPLLRVLEVKVLPLPCKQHTSAWLR